MQHRNKVIKQMSDAIVKLDWDDLAYAIIVTEYALLIEKVIKMIDLLTIRLELLEKEKKTRVSNTFNMERFMEKEYPVIDEDEMTF